MSLKACSVKRVVFVLRLSLRVGYVMKFEPRLDVLKEETEYARREKGGRN